MMLAARSLVVSRMKRPMTRMKERYRPMTLQWHPHVFWIHEQWTEGEGGGVYSPVAREEGESPRRDSVVEGDDGEVAYLPVFVASSFIVKLQSGVNKRIIWNKNSELNNLTAFRKYTLNQLTKKRQSFGVSSGRSSQVLRHQVLNVSEVEKWDINIISCNKCWRWQHVVLTQGFSQ